MNKTTISSPTIKQPATRQSITKQSIVKNSTIKIVFSLLEQEHQLTMLELLKDYTPFQQVVMTLLSSRTKDSTTIPLVKKLFAKYHIPEDFLKASREELEKEFYGVGFYRVKANNVQALSKIVIEKYDRIIPANFEELVSLPGVGRKTANCVLSYVFGQSAIAVDIHVHRISNRLGWVKTNSPEETEEELKRVVPKELWSKINQLLVDHGQRVCQPIKPKCRECIVRECCEYGRKT